MPDEVKSFLETYPPEVRDLALGARELVRRLVPDAEERVLRPWKTIAYGLGKKFCAISPHGSWVNLHFHQGALLVASVGPCAEQLSANPLGHTGGLPADVPILRA